MAARLSPVATGALLKQPRQKDQKHLRFVSTLPCIHTASPYVQVCHLRSPCLEMGKRYTGKAEKPDDKYVLPMSIDKHTEQHSMSEVAFWLKHGFDWADVIQLALNLYENTGDQEACNDIIRKARR